MRAHLLRQTIVRFKVGCFHAFSRDLTIPHPEHARASVLPVCDKGFHGHCTASTRVVMTVVSLDTGQECDL